MDQHIARGPAPSLSEVKQLVLLACRFLKTHNEAEAVLPFLDMPSCSWRSTRTGWCR